MISRTLLSLLLALFTVAASCGDDDVATDAGPRGDEPSVEIGTGYAAFTPIADGDTLEMERGSQGGQHIWTAFRMRHMDPRSAVLRIDLQRADDDQSVTLVDGIVQLRLTFVPMDGFSELAGVQLILKHPDDTRLLDTDLRLSVRVTDRAGLEAADERIIRVAWAPMPDGTILDGTGDGGTGEVPDGGDASDVSDAGS